MNVNNRISTEDLVKATQGILLNGDMGIVFRGISTDTRTLKPGYLFWCLKGERFDGHDFWQEAIDRGAKGLVIDHFPEGFRVEELPKTISVVFVQNTLKALGDLAKYWRNQLNIPVIAITGSCGKTTTKEFACNLISKFLRCAKSEKNYNNQIGVPLSILGFTKDVQVGILELGTNQPGEISRLSEIVQPDIGVITCILPAHLEGLGDLEGILKEKLSLYEHLRDPGSAVYDFDDEVLREKVNKMVQKKLSFGLLKGADVRGEVLEASPQKMRVLIEFDGRKKELDLPGIGIHNFKNFLAALASAITLGLTFEDLLEVVPELEFPVRFKVYQIGKNLLIDDTYNANPGSMKAAFDYIKTFPSDYQVVVVLGDMKELGERSSEYHEEVGRLASEISKKGLFLGEFAEDYLRGFEENGGWGKAFKNSEELKDYLKTAAKSEVFNSEQGFLILVKGSRALKMEEIVEVLREVI